MSQGQDTIDLVEIALTILACSQKELALRLKVSPPQISKWKNGEYMSDEMETRIRKLTRVGDLDPSVVRWRGQSKMPKSGSLFSAKLRKRSISDLCPATKLLSSKTSTF